MPKNFGFMLAAEGDYASSELRQGDILERTELLQAAINQAHQYYAEADGYDYFLVLTPTCDLVRRDGKCSSRYISLAAVRPLNVLIDRELEKFKRSLNAPGLFCNSNRKDRAEQFVQRLIHNTEEGYLFLPGEFFPDQDNDRCAFLLLSIALRSDHYDACLDAKRFQLALDFSAKVGHLTANLYGQVATQAIEEQTDLNPQQIISDYIDRILHREGLYWISKEQERELKLRVREKKDVNGGAVTEADVQEIWQALPSDQELLGQRVLKLAGEAGLTDEKIFMPLKNLLATDSIVGRFLK